MRNAENNLSRIRNVSIIRGKQTPIDISRKSEENRVSSAIFPGDGASRLFDDAINCGKIVKLIILC